MHSSIDAYVPATAGGLMSQDPGLRSDDGWSQSVELTRTQH